LRILFSYPLPKPPPPGVSITKTSPIFIEAVAVPPSSSRVPSARSIQLRPRAPA
jgi:hypothetical protein